MRSFSSTIDYSLFFPWNFNSSPNQYGLSKKVISSWYTYAKILTNGALSLCHLQTTAAVVSKIVPRYL